jgi:predicted SAM-dependent methyltransferase
MKHSCKYLDNSLIRYLGRLLRVFYIRTMKFAGSAIYRRFYIYTFAYHTYLFCIFNKHLDGLNLGCGGSSIKDFCNIDASPYVPCDIVARIEKIKLRSNSVSVIYSSHVFEHIPRARAKKVLAEWYRILEPSGILYICVPDQEVLFKAYLDHLPNYANAEIKSSTDLICGVIYGGQANKYDFHYQGYSFTTLKYLLESVGFKEVQRLEVSKLGFGPVNDAAISPISLNIEATK